MLRPSKAWAGLVSLACLNRCASLVPAVPVVRPELTSSLWRHSNLQREPHHSSSTHGSSSCWGSFRRSYTELYSSNGQPDGDESSSHTRAETSQVIKKSKADQDSDMFDWLASNTQVDKRVSLRTVKGGHRGLVADDDVEQGQVWTKTPPQAIAAAVARLRVGKLSKRRPVV